MNKYSGKNDRGRRRSEILQIIRQRPVHSQDELLELLGRADFRVTQPTLSRDLRDLGIIKTPTGYVVPEPEGAQLLSFTPPERREHQLEQALEEFAVSIERAGNLIVIKTPAAAAQPLARAIDAAGLEPILGTLAGDDTIFIAARSAAGAAALRRRLSQSVRPAPAARHERA